MCSFSSGEGRDVWGEENKSIGSAHKKYSGGQLLVFMAGSCNMGPAAIPDNPDLPPQTLSFHREQATNYYRYLPAEHYILTAPKYSSACATQEARHGSK